jgi:hypothetical protein
MARRAILGGAMLKSSLIAVPVTIFVILGTGLLSELCCCASPLAAVFLGFGAGLLCVGFEKPGRKDTALRRGAAAGAIAGAAALPAQILGEIVVALLLAGSGKVDISVFGLPAARATVDLWNWALNALFSAGLYGLLSVVIMAGMGAVAGAAWFRFLRKGQPEPEPLPATDLPADRKADAPEKMLLSGIVMSLAAFVFLLLLSTNWGCLAIPAAMILGSVTGILSARWAKPQTGAKAAVYGGVSGGIAGVGGVLGDIVGLLIRTFLIQTPQGINSMTGGIYSTLGMANALGERTPAEILGGDAPIVCCCSILYMASFIGLGSLCGYLWFRRNGRKPLPPKRMPPAE